MHFSLSLYFVVQSPSKPVISACCCFSLNILDIQGFSCLSPFIVCMLCILVFDMLYSIPSFPSSIMPYVHAKLCIQSLPTPTWKLVQVGWIRFLSRFSSLFIYHNRQQLEEKFIVVIAEIAKIVVCRTLKVDIDLRHLTDYLFLKSQGVQGLPKDPKWLYSYIGASLLRNMKQILDITIKQCKCCMS